MATDVEILICDGAALLPDEVPIVAGDLPLRKVYSQGEILAAFEDGTDEEAGYTPAVQVPDGFLGTGTLKVDLWVEFAAELTVTDEAVFDVRVEAITSADAIDFGAGRSFDAANTIEVDPIAAGTYRQKVTLTLTNDGVTNALAKGDHVRLLIRRATEDAADTCVGDAYITAVRLYEDN